MNLFTLMVLSIGAVWASSVSPILLKTDPHGKTAEMNLNLTRCESMEQRQENAYSGDLVQFRADIMSYRDTYNFYCGKASGKDEDCKLSRQLYGCYARLYNKLRLYRTDDRVVSQATSPKVEVGPKTVVDPRDSFQSAQ